ncbi:hypothetical protein KCP77_12425 [Salmonella enterica subsp. enterica]|nr:hypothetical protein KCP77_12425 [Salmonella enterica subsp. enterica]
MLNLLCNVELCCAVLPPTQSIRYSKAKLGGTCFLPLPERKWQNAKSPATYQHHFIKTAFI